MTKPGRLRDEPGLRRLARAATALLSIAFLALVALPIYLTRYRFLRVTAPGRIGHLTIEPDTFLKRQRLGEEAGVRGVMVVAPDAGANRALLDYWRPFITIVQAPALCALLSRAYRFPFIERDIRQVAFNKTAPYIAVQRAWGNRPALLALTDRHRQEGEARLRELGVPQGAPIVCFHCREGGYSPSDEHLHAFRNCSVENYLPAAAALAAKGFRCIRMGDPSMHRLAPQEGVIDYAHLDARSDSMDVFLCAYCRFFLGSNSGLMFVASIFGTPTGSANHAPLSTVTAFFGNDVAIPKLLWSENEQRLLTFAEIMRSDIANFRFAELYRRHGLTVLQNTPEDVADLAGEMLERCEGRAVYTAADEARQARFTRLFRPGHFGYGGVNRIGRDFLRKYENLIGEPPQTFKP